MSFFNCLEEIRALCVMQVSVTMCRPNFLMLSSSVFKFWIPFQLVRPIIRSCFETFNPSPSRGVVTVWHAAGEEKGDDAKRTCRVLTTVYMTCASAHLHHLISTGVAVLQNLYSHKQHSSKATKPKDVYMLCV